jgi:hypothetical protein
MTNPEAEQSELRTCPTRIDGAPVLFAHRVSRGQCQDRQRGRYHKCFTCVHNNAYAAAQGRTELPEPPRMRMERSERIPLGVSARAG